MPEILYIMRPQGDAEQPDGMVPIPVDQWKAAVSKHQALRLASGEATVIDPVSGDVSTVTYNDGDVEIFDHANERWGPVFYYDPEGFASFRIPGNFDNPESPIRKMAIAIASDLKGIFQGDDGELYGDFREGPKSWWENLMG